MAMDSSSSTYFLSKFNQHIHNLLTLRSIILAYTIIQVHVILLYLLYIFDKNGKIQIQKYKINTSTYGI